MELEAGLAIGRLACGAGLQLLAPSLGHRFLHNWLMPVLLARRAGRTTLAYGDKAEGRGTIGTRASTFRARMAGDRAARQHGNASHKRLRAQARGRSPATRARYRGRRFLGFLRRSLATLCVASGISFADRLSHPRLRSFSPLCGLKSPARRLM